MQRTVPILLLVALLGVNNALADEDATGTPRFQQAISGTVSTADALTGDTNRTSALGIDYMYRLNRLWEIGVQFDFNYDADFKEYESFAVVPVFAYEAADRFPVFFGAGVEHRRESGEDELILRVGCEYGILLSDSGRWNLLPGMFIDYIDDEFIASVTFGVSYSF